MIVVDASVFVKLFKVEDGSDTARILVDELLDKGEGFVAPSLVLYETLSAALHIEQPFDKVGSLFDRLRGFGLRIEDPTRDELILAEEIARTQAPGGGYPALFDSFYHSMAIARGGTFVTADQRHLVKAGHFGSVVSLATWSSAR